MSPEAQAASPLGQEGTSPLADLVKHAPMGLMLLRAEKTKEGETLRILAANPAVIELLSPAHLSLAELIGKSFAEVFTPLFEEEFATSISAQIRSGTDTPRTEICYRDQQGSERAFSIRAFAVPEGRVGILFEDITERRQVEKTLKRTAKELRRSNSELEQFAYVASHDLQEPLRTIAGATQLLALGCKDKLDSEALENVRVAIDGAKRMQVLINELLNYCRLGIQRKPFELVDCQKSYEAAVSNLRVAIEESGAKLTHQPLPAVTGDSVQLTQLFQNLLANGIKFRAALAPQIHVAVGQVGQEWQFAVRDNGIGIDPKHFSRLFTIFQRLHSQEEYPGTGIGLAVSKKIVEQHGGRIWVESAPGRGSTFYFTIPVPDSQSVAPKGSPIEHPVESRTPIGDAKGTQ